MSHIIIYLMSYWWLMNAAWKRKLLSWQNIVVYNFVHQENHNIISSKTIYEINIRKDGKIKNILITTIFLNWCISTAIVTITPPSDRDAYVIITTESVVTTNLGWKITNYIRMFKYRMNPSTVSNNDVWTSVIA